MSNTCIAHGLNTAYRKPEGYQAFKETAIDIVKAHNQAVVCGWLSIPHLKFVEVGVINDKYLEVGVTTASGGISLDEIHNLKTDWGADDIVLLSDEKGFVLSVRFLLK